MKIDVTVWKVTYILQPITEILDRECLVKCNGHLNYYQDYAESEWIRLKNYFQIKTNYALSTSI